MLFLKNFVLALSLTHIYIYHAAVATKPFPLVAGVLLVDARSASIISFEVRIVGRFSMW